MTVYKSGKPVPLKIDSGPTNADFIRGSEHGLYFLHQEREAFVNSVHAFHQSKPLLLTKNQEIFLTEIYLTAHDFLNTFPLINAKNHRITLAIRNQVNELESAAVNHQTKLKSTSLPREMNAAAKRMIDSTFEFVQAFIFLYPMIQTQVKNRPRRWAVKNAVGNLIEIFQNQNNTYEFPRYPDVVEQINLERTDDPFELSRRTYAYWKVQWNDGTYFNF